MSLIRILFFLLAVIVRASLGRPMESKALVVRFLPKLYLLLSFQEWNKFARTPIQVFYLFLTMVVMEGIMLQTNTMAIRY